MPNCKDSSDRLYHLPEMISQSDNTPGEVWGHDVAARRQCPMSDWWTAKSIRMLEGMSCRRLIREGLKETRRTGIASLRARSLSSKI